ncbi:jupiter microtubule associated homolog 2 [Entelurus aequoreus]|uniref:jupiter microtubule associated homolog 2 n=1 Tax=Entelurus aequoreus TaxID=161455 RepID=UPI002B1D483F|nr:jupiter microtubule associated homolog 2 [Entelurus aequoreus]
MTSTNMFQGLATGSKPSSRVLQPPGGGSSDLFGGYEEEAPQSRRLNKMASNVFASPEEPQTVPRRSNPPGGKSSGIFGDPEPPVHQQRPGAPTSSIFASPDHAAPQSPSKAHPNKPKDNLTVRPEAESPAPEVEIIQAEVKEQCVLAAKEDPPAAVVVADVAPPPEPASSSPGPDDNSLKNHEPHLGPKPRSHNRVLNPPGGKSSVVFY